MDMRIIIALLIALGLTGWLGFEMHAQQATRAPESQESLRDRWTWALRQDRPSAGAWIGYAIRNQRDHERDHDDPDASHRRTLQELIDGKTVAGGESLAGTPDDEIAILFLIERDGRPGDVQLARMDDRFDLDGRPLFWLGKSSDAESIAFLKDRFDEADGAGMRDDLVTAVGIHEESERAVPLLRTVLEHDEAGHVREKAAFWLGQSDQTEALEALKQAIRTDPSSSVREHAVFALSQMDRKEATMELIRLARQADDRGVREKAIFWLGQQASEEAVEAIQDAVFDAGETEVQEQAVFALSQLPRDQGIPLLVEVVRTHPSAQVRRKAIFWLGQSGDPRALDVIVELLR